jgi:hypothetical protein
VEDLDCEKEKHIHLDVRRDLGSGSLALNHGYRVDYRQACSGPLKGTRHKFDEFPSVPTADAELFQLFHSSRQKPPLVCHSNGGKRAKSAGDLISMCMISRFRSETRFTDTSLGSEDLVSRPSDHDLERGRVGKRCSIGNLYDKCTVNVRFADWLVYPVRRCIVITALAVSILTVRHMLAA